MSRKKKWRKQVFNESLKWDDLQLNWEERGKRSGGGGVTTVDDEMWTGRLQWNDSWRAVCAGLQPLGATDQRGTLCKWNSITFKPNGSHHVDSVYRCQLNLCISQYTNVLNLWQRLVWWSWRPLPWRWWLLLWSWLRARVNSVCVICLAARRGRQKFPHCRFTTTILCLKQKH